MVSIIIECCLFALAVLSFYYYIVLRTNYNVLEHESE